LAQAGAKGKRMRFLCIFGIPRTGSTHLAMLLKACPEFNVLAELFHSKSTTRLTEREQAALAARSGLADEAATNWRRRHPLAALEAVHEAGGARVVAVKLFPNFLPRKLIEAELLSRDEVACAVLTRRVIESFISSRKAISVDKFGGVDTTDVKIDLSPAEFVPWARKMRAWYRFAREALEARGKPYARIDFETTLADRPDAEALGDVLSLLAPQGLAVEVPPAVRGGKRQDLEERYRERVGNWHSFALTLRSDPEHAELLEWSRRNPWE
jgi:hypothetical protein